MILCLAILLPLSAAILIAACRLPPRVVSALLSLSALPALLIALFADGASSVSLPWTILESELDLGRSGAAVLFFVAALWGVAGWYAGSRHSGVERVRRFAFFWLTCMAGNFGVVLAGDVATFYTAFAAMSFAAYGLVAHNATAKAMRAARIYIAMAVLGEAMLIGGLLLAAAGAESLLLPAVAAAGAESPYRDVIVALLFGGFAVKAGVLPLHFWLPLAHPVAPVPASAVLSGAMIKAGLLGWMHLLPGGHPGFEAWGAGFIVIGLATAFYAAACGVYQRDPKTVLAYSSVSQMGIMLLVVGAGLAEPAAWAGVLVVLTIYALNHAFAKGALFLGAGVAAAASPGLSAPGRRLLLAGLALPALAIAGAPLMGGAVAKAAVKVSVEGVPSGLAPWLLFLLPLSAVATTVLLGHFLLLIWKKTAPEGERVSSRGFSIPWPWLAAVGLSAFGVYFSVPWFSLELRTAEPSWRGLGENAWPILAGAALLWGLARWPRWRAVVIPPGDLIVLLERLFRRQEAILRWLIAEERFRIDYTDTVERLAHSKRIAAFLDRAERAFRRRETAGFFMLVLVLSIVWLVVSG